MKPTQEVYLTIPKKSDWTEQFMYFPGAYHKCCGDTCAVYSYGIQPSKVDENDIPYYEICHKCKP